MKRGQIAHLDRSATNNQVGNLAFLCLAHHEEYDSLSRQARRFTPTEVIHYQQELYDFLQGERVVAWTDTPVVERPEATVDAVGASAPTYDRRIPVYRAIKAYLDSIITEGAVDLPQLRALVKETDEALFLFGPEVADYIAELYQKGVNLRRARKVLELTRESDDRAEAVMADSELLNFFTEQYEVSRRVLLPYLQLRDPDA